MGTITLVGHVTARPGREEDLAALLDELVVAARERDPGTLSYGFYAEEASGGYSVVEVYRDSESVIAHLGNAGPLLARLGDLLEPGADGAPHVYGDPSPELLECYVPFGPVYHARVA
jgi:quinol monooxygenase YgiN